MDDFATTRWTIVGLPKFAAAVFLPLLFASPAVAQESDSGVSDTQVQSQAQSGEPSSGRIIYARDVTNRSVGRRPFEGVAHSIETGPERQILAAMALGLKPISDSESAGIIGQIEGQTEIASNAIALGLETLSESRSVHSAGVSPGQMQGGQIAGAMSNLNTGLQGALGALSNALGGGE